MGVGLFVREPVPGELVVSSRNVTLLDTELLQDYVSRHGNGHGFEEGEVAVEALPSEC